MPAVEELEVSKDFKNELRQKTKPFINDTDHQVKKLHAGLKFRAEFNTNRCYWWEQQLVKGDTMKDFLGTPGVEGTRKAVYIPHEIAEGDPLYGKYLFCMEIFIIPDRIIRRRIEKLLKTKLIWEVYDYEPPASENI